MVKKYRPQEFRKPIVSKENILNQDFSTRNICEKWVADITYIPTRQMGGVTCHLLWIYTRKRLLAILSLNECFYIQIWVANIQHQKLSNGLKKIK